MTSLSKTSNIWGNLFRRGTTFFPSLQLKPVKPPQRKEDVLAHLNPCEIFHFAGHGQSNPLEPSRNCLFLKDWKDNLLTVGDLRGHKLPVPWLSLRLLDITKIPAPRPPRLRDHFSRQHGVNIKRVATHSQRSHTICNCRFGISRACQFWQDC